MNTAEDGDVETHRGYTVLSDLSVFYAFIARGAGEFVSNRTNLVLDSLWIIMDAFAWGIIATVIPGSSYTAAITDVSHNAVDYLMIGQLTRIFVSGTERNLSNFVMGREFPHIWSSPTGGLAILAGAYSWRMCWMAMWGSTYALIGHLFFGMSLHISLALVLVLLLGFLVILFVDLVAAGVALLTKSPIDPVRWFLTITSGLVTGLYFPPSFLPGWLRWISGIHPQTYLLELTRRTISLGETTPMIWGRLVSSVLLGSAALLVGLAIFYLGFRKARTQGTIGHR